MNAIEKNRLTPKNAKAVIKHNKPRDFWAQSLDLTATLSPINRRLAEPILFRIRASGARPQSVYSHAVALRKANDVLGGASFAEATPDDWSRVIAWLRENMAEASVHIYTGLLRGFVRHVLNTKDLPYSYDQAMKRKRLKRKVVGQVIQPDQFRSIVAACDNVGNTDTWQDGHAYPISDRNKALFAVLYQTGFRISEALSLRIGCVSVDAEGLITLALDPNAPGLKTGARTVVVCDTEDKLIRTWLAMHPSASDATAPLFPAFPKARIHNGITYNTARTLLYAIQGHLGMRGNLGEPFTCHDFRHTCATAKARAGWPEHMMRRFFGWAGSSTMPSTYVHLTLDDQRERVRRDLEQNGPTPVLEKGEPRAGDLGAVLAHMANLQSQLLTLLAKHEPLPTAPGA